MGCAVAQTNDPLKSAQAQALLNNPARLKALLSSPEVRQLAQLLDQSSGGGLKQAAGAAKAGNPERLTALMRGLSASSEGAALMQKLQGKLEK